MKKALLFLALIPFLFSYCGDGDKEYIVEKKSVWKQTVEGVTHEFRFSWKGGYTGNGEKNLLEHRGDCHYYTYPEDEPENMSLGQAYKYDRDGDDIKIYTQPDLETDPAIWVQGVIDDDKMILSGDNQSFELTKYSEINS